MLVEDSSINWARLINEEIGGSGGGNPRESLARLFLEQALAF